jgi:26S proteasome regulatory subunit (ATPase 3-interacting protein)
MFASMAYVYSVALFHSPNLQKRFPVVCAKSWLYIRFWQFATDYLPPQDAASLAEDLGIEIDTLEHIALESTPLCLVHNPPESLGKRKRS